MSPEDDDGLIVAVSYDTGRPYVPLADAMRLQEQLDAVALELLTLRDLLAQDDPTVP